jgi:UDPglucose--hexose-1-phosphate uridylyltransferase
LGSNADLPIVGGSILSHDHMQGGRYVFAMEKAPVIKDLYFDGYSDVEAGIVKWPLSVIRLTSKNRKQLLDLAEKILDNWRVYSDKDYFIFAETDGEKHNTITPIARRKGESYQLDLVLRNNITTEEYPLGVYHPHQDKHNIKKENIGLIEVMGLAVLPSRLKKEMADLEYAILENRDLEKDEELSKHSKWFDSFKDKYTFTKENTWEILQQQIGNTFVAVLEDAGVYKCNEKGLKGFLKFTDTVNSKK